MNLPRVTKSPLTPFGTALRKLRVEKSQRLYDLASRIGVTSSYVSAIECGRRAIPDGFIELLQESYSLTDEQVETLRKAAELSQTHFLIQPYSPDAQMLTAAFARKINSLSPDEIQKILNDYFLWSTAVEKEVHQYDRWATKLTRKEIKAKAHTVREGVLPTLAKFNSVEKAFQIVTFIDLCLPSILNEYVLEVLADDEMPSGVLGFFRVSPPAIIVAQSVYDAGANNEDSARWILAHECGHLWLMHGGNATFLQSVARTQAVRKANGRLRASNSAEAQANEFAAELLMPAKQCSGLSAREISLKFGVTDYIASRRAEFLTKRTKAPLQRTQSNSQVRTPPDGEPPTITNETTFHRAIWQVDFWGGKPRRTN